jgi:CTP-dependent riboflavin kinase
MATRCEQHARLGRAYEDAARAYLSAVGQLRENIGTSTRVEYGELADRAGAAREAARRAMKKLQEHAFKHRCSSYGIAVNTTRKSRAGLNQLATRCWSRNAGTPDR